MLLRLANGARKRLGDQRGKRQAVQRIVRDDDQVRCALQHRLCRQQDAAVQLVRLRHRECAEHRAADVVPGRVVELLAQALDDGHQFAPADVEAH